MVRTKGSFARRLAAGVTAGVLGLGVLSSGGFAQEAALPPDGAARFIVTVPCAEAPAGTLVGATVREDR